MGSRKNRYGRYRVQKAKATKEQLPPRYEFPSLNLSAGTTPRQRAKKGKTSS